MADALKITSIIKTTSVNRVRVNCDGFDRNDCWEKRECCGDGDAQRCVDFPQVAS